MGTLSVLNVGGGDIRISFDKASAAEAIRAKRVITDMMRRGYAVLIEVDGAFQRAVDFDENVGEYIIADYDPMVETTGAEDGEQEERIERPEIAVQKAKRKTTRRRISMERANAVGVARSAGG